MYDDKYPAATPEVDDSVNPTEAAPFGSSTATGLSDSPGGGVSTEGSHPLVSSAQSRASDSSDPTDEGGAGGAAAAPAQFGSQARERIEPFVGQLQHMISNLSTQAEPMLREIAAKAAELASAAAVRAGPLAHKAAETTANLGDRMATRGKEVAADLRRSSGASADLGDRPASSSASSGTETGWSDLPDPSDVSAASTGFDDMERDATQEQAPGI